MTTEERSTEDFTARTTNWDTQTTRDAASLTGSVNVILPEDVERLARAPRLDAAIARVRAWRE